MDSTDSITYDDALTKTVGQFGPGQWLILTCASIPQLANAAAFFLWVFITVDPAINHGWECRDDTDAACKAVWQQASPSSSSLCGLHPDQWTWTSQDSLMARFNLICADAWKVQFTNSLMFMGAFIGSGVFGHLCDSLGRKRPLFLATAIIATSMYASLAAPSYWVMAALRAVTGIGAAGQSHCMFLLSTEPVGPAYRGLASIASMALFTVGEFLMVALAYALPAWQHFVLAAACINAAVLLLYPFVSESARWLLTQGRTDEATAILQRIAKANQSSLPAQTLVSCTSSKQLNGAPEALAEEGRCNSTFSTATAASESEAPLGFCQLLRRRRTAIRLMVMLLTWYSLMISYYGIAMASGGIPGSIYVTFSIGVVFEVFALLVVGPTVDRVGRHNIVALGQLVGGSACLACAMVSGGITQAVLAGIGKFGCSAAESVISIYTAELLPTSCRSSVMGVCSQASRLGSITAPFLLMLGAQLGSVGGHSQVFIPFIVFGCLALLSGLLMLLMPETLGAAMPEKVEDLNMLVSAFTAKPWRHGTTQLFAFVFRTRAASAYTSNTAHTTSAAAPTNSTQAAVQENTDGPNAAAAKAEKLQARKRPPAFDSRRVTDSERRVSWYGDDSELASGGAGAAAARTQPAVLTVHVTADCRGDPLPDDNTDSGTGGGASTQHGPSDRML